MRKVKYGDTFMYNGFNKVDKDDILAYVVITIVTTGVVFFLGWLGTEGYQAIHAWADGLPGSL